MTLLVLKRKVGEKVMIGDDVEVVVLGVEGDYVKLGFNAPQHVQIMRKELHQGIAAENAAAETIKPNKQQIDNVLKNFKK
ncbi:carbon storage regulator CsrA [Paenibacillus marinisediminis]